MNPLQTFQLIQALLTSSNQDVGTGVLGPLQPLLIQFMSTTTAGLTIDNPVVIGTWSTMLALSDVALALLIIVGATQIMVSSSTGALTIPLSQFVPKIIITALFMHLSAFFGRQLLILNNDLCSTINANFNAFLNLVNNGSRITPGQGLLLSLGVLILLNFSLLRLLFQAFERLALWNLLFVLGPLAFLFSLLPQTSSIFTSWGRMFLVVTFTQSLQLLAFTLGLALLAHAGLSGIGGILLALAMLFLVAKIPDALARFSSLSLQRNQGASQLLLTTIVTGARLLTA